MNVSASCSAMTLASVLIAGCAGAEGYVGEGRGLRVVGDDDAASAADSGAPVPNDEFRGRLTWRVVDATGAAGTPVKRRYGVYLPSGTAKSNAIPLVMVAHGYAMSAQGMFDLTGYSKVAEREKFALAVLDGEPNGAGGTDTFAGPGPWNVGQDVHGPGRVVESTADDVGFIAAVKSHIGEIQTVDAEHVFLTGFSMGAYFANHVGCSTGRSVVRGIAPHSGGTYTFSTCAPEPVPVLVLHGKSDILISHQWGIEARDQWAQHNRCSNDVDVIQVKGGQCEVSRGCPSGGQVQLCNFDNLAHAWAGGTVAPSSFASIYSSITTFSPTAADLVRGAVTGILSYDTAVKGLINLVSGSPTVATIPSKIPNWSFFFSAPEYESAAELQWRFWKEHAWQK